MHVSKFCTQWDLLKPVAASTIPRNRDSGWFFALTYDSWSRLTRPDSRDSHRSAENQGCSGPTYTGNVPDGTSSGLEGKESQGLRVSVHSGVSKGEAVKTTGDSRCSPQSRSSELSPQSLSLSHSQVPGMHCSLSQRNSLSEQGLGAACQRQGDIQSRQQSMNSDFVSILYFSLQILPDLVDELRLS